MRHLPILPLLALVPLFAGEAAPSKAVSSESGYELRGFFGSGENLEVSLRKSGDDASRWIKVGQKSGDLLVEKADPKTGIVTLVVKGTRHSLRLAVAIPAPPVDESPGGDDTGSGPDKGSAEYRRMRFRQMMEKTPTPRRPSSIA